MKVLTIDGNNLVHRVYWVANNIKNVSENYHVYMFLNSFKSYVEMFNPDRIYCVWDEKPDYRQNKRKEILEEYKGNRDKDYGKEVHDKNEIIKELLQYMGIPSIFPRDYEADDVIGIINNVENNHSKIKFYLTKKLFRHIIVTVDRDLCQLIDGKTTVYDPIRKYEITNENFEEYLKGEVKLTEDEQNIYKRNLQLVKLTHDNEEVMYVNEQLNKAKFDTDWDKFLTKCKELKFSNILKKESTWYSAFFQDNRLIDLLS